MKIDYAGTGDESEAWVRALQPVLAFLLVATAVLILVGFVWWKIALRDG